MRALLAIAVSWLVLVGLWMLYVGQTTKENAIAGGIAAGVTLVFGVLLARLGLLRYRLDGQWLARAAKLPWQLLRDYAVVTLALLHGRPRGEFLELEFPVGGSDPRSAGRRALVGLLGTICPNAYVVDFDRERKVVLVHALDPKRAKGGLL
jgi:multisubunit Na+/H+ antiporter MnhE subunit